MLIQTHPTDNAEFTKPQEDRETTISPEEPGKIRLPVFPERNMTGVSENANTGVSVNTKTCVSVNTKTCQREEVSEQRSTVMSTSEHENEWPLPRDVRNREQNRDRTEHYLIACVTRLS